MILTAITFLVLLTVLVLIHELGHFLVARFIGVHVEEFGLGLPPMIVGKKIGKTIYSINWLPIGGFVRLAGEDAEEGQKTVKNLKNNEYFWARSKKERAAILSAGVFMNFTLAVAITAGLLISGVKEPSGKVHVERVVPGTPAQTAGLLVGDIISRLDQSVKPTHTQTPALTPKTPSQMIEYVNAHKGQQITIDVIRNGTTLHLVATPRTVIPKGEGALGVAISDLEIHKYPLSEAPGKALTITLSRAWDMLTSLGKLVWTVVTLQPLVHKTPLPEIAGPIGIAQVTGEAVKFGWAAVLEFASILSLNLAVLNVLPIPALDGGRLAFVFLEKILGKKVRPAFEKSAHQIGMIVLLILIGLVTINDIVRIARGG